MPIQGSPVPGHPKLYLQKGEGHVTLAEAQAMKRHEMEQPAVPGRRYLTDIRGCNFDMEEIRDWVTWNKENTPAEYLGPVAYVADEPVVTAYMLMMSASFAPDRPAAVFSTLEGALDFLDARSAIEALADLGVAID